VYYKKEEYRQWVLHQSNAESKRMLVHWVEHGSQNNEIAEYLRRKGIERVAVYGMAEVGQFIFQNLQDSGITVVCGIDRNKEPYGQKVVRPEDFQEDVDAIIVTAVYYFSEIYDTLNQKVGNKVPIFGLDEIIYELCEETA